MIKKLSVITIFSFACLMGAACGDDDGGSGSAAISKLRSCGLLSPGNVSVPDTDEPRMQCNFNCFTNASCDDLETLMCTEDTPPALGACIENCWGDEGEFECADGSDTIPESWVCDCYEDCADGSDEINCPADACFQCTDGSDTIPESWVCDCYEDCADGSDEINCPADACFECADGSGTIPSTWVCDFEPDCNDGSDEDQGCATILCPDN